MTTKAEILARLPERHDTDCVRALPYSSPLWRSLDPDCQRCRGLIELLDEARDRRIAEVEELKRKIVSKLDGLPHMARGSSRQELMELSESLSKGFLTRKALRELEEDRLVQSHIIGGVHRYVLYGR